MEISIHKTEDRTYKSATIELLGKKFCLLQVSGPGKYDNYISISVVKHMPNPGRTFLSFDDATRGYKSPAMKVAILMVEADFKNITLQE